MGDYECLFEQVPIPMWFISAASMKVVRANRAAVRMLGQKKDSCRGLTLNALRDRLEASRNGERVPFELLKNESGLPFSFNGENILVGLCPPKEAD